MAIIEKDLTKGTPSERAWEIYYALRAVIETPENSGKLIVIDTESGDYEIAEDDMGLVASERLKARRPDKKGVIFRIGYKTAVSFAGGPERLDE